MLNDTATLHYLMYNAPKIIDICSIMPYISVNAYENAYYSKSKDILKLVDELASCREDNGSSYSLKATLYIMRRKVNILKVKIARRSIGENEGLKMPMALLKRRKSKMRNILLYRKYYIRRC